MITVGDRVKIISNTPPDDEYDYLIGEIGTVMYIAHPPYSDNVPFKVKVDSDGYYYFAEQLSE